MQRKLTAIILCLSSLLIFQTVSHAGEIDQQRRHFKDAYKLIQSGKEYDLVDLSKGLEKYPLYAYLQFAHLSSNVASKSEKDIENFLSVNSGAPLAQRLRVRWLYSLARREKWKTFLQNYKPRSGNVLQCYQLQARLKTAPVDDALLNDIKSMWLVGKSQADECDPAFKVLYSSKALTGSLIMQRIRLAMKAKNLRLAKHLSRRLNKKDQEKVQLWREVYTDPAKHLQDPALKKDTAFSRGIIIYGLKKLTNQNSLKAYTLWNKLADQHKFSQAEVNAMEREITFTAVQQKLPRAGKWLDALQDQQTSQYIQRYLIRYATQNQDWKSLQKWTKKTVAPDFNKLRWWYWRARSMEETGNKEEADQIFNGLSRKRDYYGFLSAEKLGQDYRFSDHRLPLSKDQKVKLLKNQGIVRARELYLLEMYEDARREWTHSTNNMQRDQLLQAAVLADDWGWHDRTILTLGKAKAYNDLKRRFPLPFNKTIKTYAKKRALPTSIIYTLMRSESAFIHDVRSSAGALGLMQLMPATAKQTAKKIGYKYKNSRQLADPETNIALGTAYLKEMLERFDGNFIMAAAAYNAGPHRVKRWRPKQGCMPGEFWVETIPFNETRRYVRRALFYSVLYQWRMKEKINSVHSQLKPVPALEVTCH